MDPTQPPTILGKTYSTLKKFFGVTGNPQFNLDTELEPTIDLSQVVNENELEIYGQSVTFTTAGSSACVTLGDTYQLPCPFGYEHIYLALSLTACNVTTFPLRVMIITPNMSTAYTAGRPLIVYRNTSSLAEQYLDKTVLPIYVPPSGILQFEAGSLSGASINLSYMRVVRTAGLGPLAV